MRGYALSGKVPGNITDAVGRGDKMGHPLLDRAIKRGQGLLSPGDIRPRQGRQRREVLYPLLLGLQLLCGRHQRLDRRGGQLGLNSLQFCRYLRLFASTQPGIGGEDQGDTMGIIEKPATDKILEKGAGCDLLA